MKSHTSSWMVIGGALLLGASAVAQDKSVPPDKPHMSMNETMKGCREHCDKTTALLDRTVKTIDDALSSNDVAKMRTALEETRKPLADMQQHMSMCMNMMGMMQKMHDMGGMMHGTAGTADHKGQAADAARKSSIDITFTTVPDPPKAGENTFEVTVKGADGKPVADANVALNFHMGAMPSMNMPAMRHTVRLKHVKDGLYRGSGTLSMAGRWEVTTVVTKGGKQIGSRKTAVTAK